MSSAGQAVGALVGGVVGFFIGGPAGAVQGAQLGAAIGTAIDPPKGPTLRAPRLEDLSVPDYRLGTPIARLHGTCGMMCQLGWVENNRMTETVRSEEVGGKGGGGQTVETVSYSVTCAMHGPDIQISGVDRIWVSGQLIARLNPTDLTTLQATAAQNIGTNGAFGAESLTSQSFSVYTGAPDQQPDPVFETDITNAPAWRGMGTIVFYNWDLKNQGNSLMAFSVKAEFVSEGETSVTEVGTLSAYGPSANSGSYSGCGDLLLTGYAQLLIRIGTPVLQEKIAPNGNIISAPLETAASINELFDIDSDQPGVAYGIVTEPNEVIIENFGVFDRPFMSNSSGMIYVRNSVLRFILVSIGSGARIYNGNTLVNTLPDVDLVCMANDDLLVGLSKDGSQIVYFDRDGNETDRFTLDEDWPDAATNPSLYTAFSIASDGVTCWLFSYDQSKYLIWDIYTEQELDRGTVDLSWVAGQRKRLQVRGNNAALFLPGGSFSPNPTTVTYFSWGVAGSPTLQNVVSTELKQNETIVDGDIDVSGLTGTVKGMLIAGKMTANKIISPLKYRYMFDVFASGYKIKALHRGQTVVKTIPWDDLGVSSGGGGTVQDSVITEREMDHMLPTQVAVGYLDPDRNYERNEQLSYDRDSGQSANKQTIDLPLVGTATEMVEVADQLMDIAWHERLTYQFKLPGIYRDLEPCDVVETTDPNGRYYRMRLNTVEHQTDGVMNFTAVREKAGLYNQSGLGDGGLTSSVELEITTLDTIGIFLDIPLINAVDDQLGYGVIAYGTTTPWPGATIFRSTDDGQTWDAVASVTTQGTVGQQMEGDPLPESDARIIDRDSVLDVVLVNGTLTSVTEAQMINGAGLYAYGNFSRWEIIHAATATQISSTRWELTTIVRGAKGTEHLTGTHEVGDYVIPLDDNNITKIGVSSGETGFNAITRFVTVGQNFDFADDIVATYSATNLKPLSPVDVEVYQDGNDWIFEWTARSRFETTWWSTGTVAQKENPEQYAIIIYDTGGFSVRTISATTETATYTEQQQTVDFGSAVSTFSYEIYALNPIVGRGRTYSGSV